MCLVVPYSAKIARGGKRTTRKIKIYTLIDPIGISHFITNKSEFETEDGSWRGQTRLKGGSTTSL